MRRLRLAQEPHAFAVGGKHDFQQRVGAVGRLLGKPANAHARGQTHFALLGADLAGYDAEQRGLSAAVAADQADAAPAG